MKYPQPVILGLVGQNANQVLWHASHSIRLMLEPYNVVTEIVDLHAQGGYEKLTEILKTRSVLFAFAYAGVGSTLRGNHDVLWTEAKIPFLSLMFDHPFYNIGNHKIDSRYVVNSYYCKDFYDVQNAYIKSNQPAALLPMAGPKNHFLYNGLPWQERDIKAFYVKNGVNPATIVEKFSLVTPHIQKIISDLLPVICQRSDIYLTDLVRDRLNEEGAAVEDNWRAFIFIVRMLDEYVRAWRATAMVNALKHIDGALIVGDGWDHIDKIDAKATFLPAEPHDIVYQRYRRSRCVVNTNPYFRYGMHERICEAFKTNSSVLTDENDFYREHFSNLPSFNSFKWSDTQWQQELKESVEAIAAKEQDPQPAYDRIHQLLDPERFLSAAINLVKQVRTNQKIEQKSQKQAPV